MTTSTRARATNLGRVRNGKVYDPDGKYAGTIVGDRVVYRSTDGAPIGSPFISTNRVGTARANRVASAIWDDEPPFPDERARNRSASLVHRVRDRHGLRLSA